MISVCIGWRILFLCRVNFLRMSTSNSIYIPPITCIAKICFWILLARVLFQCSEIFKKDGELSWQRLSFAAAEDGTKQVKFLSILKSTVRTALTQRLNFLALGTKDFFCNSGPGLQGGGHKPPATTRPLIRIGKIRM